MFFVIELFVKNLQRQLSREFLGVAVDFSTPSGSRQCVGVPKRQRHGENQCAGAYRLRGVRLFRDDVVARLY